MHDRSQRLLIFIGSLVAALLVILVVMLVTSDGGESAADSIVATTAIDSTTTEPPGTTEPPPTTEPEDTPSTEAADDPPPAEEPPPAEDPPPAEAPPPAEEPPPAGPVEIFRGTADIRDPGLFGTGTIPLFARSVAGDDFATSHPWSLIASTEPSWQACAAQTTTGRNVANPVKLTILGISNGWYGCSRMEDDHLARIHLIDVQPTNRRVIAEIVIWT